jgi:glycerophosphoryl diester phosphodiesterase
MRILITLLFCLGVLNIVANPIKLNPVYLTGYTVLANADAVGEVKCRNGSVVAVEISGRDGALFNIDKDHVLRVNKDKIRERSSRFEIVVKVKASSGEYSSGFIIIRDEFLKNKVVAHRGAWKNTGAPENSIAAFNHAVRLGCEGSEFDVHMTADSLPVVNHDATIQGTSIAKTSSTELLKIKLANGEPIPTLERYLKAGKEQVRTKLILEIKSSELGNQSSIALAGKVVELVERMQAQAWTDYIAFDYDVCLEVLRLAPYAKVAYLNGDKSPAELAEQHFFGLDYNLKVIDKNVDWTADAHARKLTVNVWTVNDRDAMNRLLQRQVDFITTNEPEILLEIVRK